MARAKKANNRAVRFGESARTKCEGCGGGIDVNGYDWVSILVAGRNYLVHYGGDDSSNCADSVMALQRQSSSDETKEGSVPKFEDL
jgi:hypothetical protein